MMKNDKQKTYKKPCLFRFFFSHDIQKGSRRHRFGKNSPKFTAKFGWQVSSLRKLWQGLPPTATEQETAETVQWLSLMQKIIRLSLKKHLDLRTPRSGYHFRHLKLGAFHLGSPFRLEIVQVIQYMIAHHTTLL